MNSFLIFQVFYLLVRFYSLKYLNFRVRFGLSAKIHMNQYCFQDRAQKELSHSFFQVKDLGMFLCRSCMIQFGSQFYLIVLLTTLQLFDFLDYVLYIFHIFVGLIQFLLVFDYKKVYFLYIQSLFLLIHF